MLFIVFFICLLVLIVYFKLILKLYLHNGWGKYQQIPDTLLEIKFYKNT